MNTERKWLMSVDSCQLQGMENIRAGHNTLIRKQSAKFGMKIAVL